MPSKNELLSEVCSLIIYISPELFKNWKNNSYYKSIGILRSITKSSSQYSIFLDIMTQIRSNVTMITYSIPFILPTIVDLENRYGKLNNLEKSIIK